MSSSAGGHRINRYIMECKLSYGINKGRFFTELIDTLWNVNLVRWYGYTADTLELIDTLWNVNLFLPCSLLPSMLELIDTLWNVNL